jgi:hypothetical protein
MSGGYRVRLASFARQGGVYSPSGGAFGPASRKLGRALRPPPLYQPPVVRCWAFDNFEAAEGFAASLRNDTTVVVVEPIERPAPAPRPRQMSLFGGDAPRQTDDGRFLMQFPDKPSQQ